jgi:hypothetical protein
MEETTMSWSYAIAAVALLFSVTCFYLFVLNAVRKPVPDSVVDEAAQRVQDRGIDPATIGALAKALADAFSKVGPAALALIGALLFLLLSGAAAGVYDLRGAQGAGETKTQVKDNAKRSDGDRPAGSTQGNDSAVRPKG